MTLSLTDYSLPNVYIGDAEVPEYVPLPPVVPTPSNNESNDEPEKPSDPTYTRKIRFGDIILITIGFVILVLVIVLIGLCYMA